MKFNILKSDFRSALETAARAAAKKVSIETLTGVLLEAKEKELKITGYNLQIGISVHVTDIIIAEEGACVLSPVIIDIVKKAPSDNIVVEVEENGKTTIKSGRAKNKIMALKAEDFPALPKIKDESTHFEIEGELFKQLLKNTLYATSKNTVNPILCGTYIVIKDNVITACSCDGFQCSLSEHKIKSSENCDFVIHSETISELLKILPDEKVDICLTSRHITFKAENFYIISSLVEGSFPDCIAFFTNKPTFSIKVNKPLLRDAVERALTVQEINTSPIIVSCTGKKEIILSTSTSVGSSEEELEVDSNYDSPDEFKMGINPKYLLNVLDSIDPDNIILNISDPLKPMTVMPQNGDGEKRLVVPMRLCKS